MPRLPARIKISLSVNLVGFGSDVAALVALETRNPLGRSVSSPSLSLVTAIAQANAGKLPPLLQVEASEDDDLLQDKLLRNKIWKKMNMDNAETFNPSSPVLLLLCLGL